MIYLIRHAESIGNAGGRTLSHDSIGLSEKGYQQAKDFADGITKQPDLIIVSPFLRTKQTSQALLDKFPDTKVEIWPIQEFSFLDANRCANTTVEERYCIREEYLDKNDPDFIHGVGAESFNEFINRVDNMLNQLQQLDQSKQIMVFTHGFIIKAALMRLNNTPPTIKSLFDDFTIANCSTIKLQNGRLV